MPRRLRFSAESSSRRATLRRSTEGTVMPCSLPRVLSHMHRALWRCPAIMRIVRRGEPGIEASHSGAGRCSMR
jgi:hypothetical protein